MFRCRKSQTTNGSGAPVLNSFRSLFAIQMHYRWPILICAGLIAMGNEFVCSQPSVLTQRLKGKAEQCDGKDLCLYLSVLQFNLLFTVQAIVSACGSICCGYLADRIGTAKLTYLASSLMPLGQLLAAVSPYVRRSDQFTVIILGQFLLGLSDGVLITLVHRVKSSWFNYGELGVAFGVHALCMKSGAALVFLLYSSILPSVGLTGCFWIGFGVAIIVCTATLTMGYLDDQHPALETWRSEVKEGGPIHELKLVASVVKRQPMSFWLIAVSAFFFSGTILSFNVNAPSLFAERYNFSETKSTFVAGIEYYVQILAPFIGWTTDRFGHRDCLLLTSGVLLVTALGIAFTSTVPPGAYTFIFGIADSCFIVGATSSMSIISGDGSAGIGFGFLKLFDSLGQTLWTSMSGELLLTAEIPGGNHIWKWFLCLLMGIALVALLLALALVIFNQLRGNHLSFSQEQRRLIRSDTETSTFDSRMAECNSYFPVHASVVPNPNYRTFPTQAELIALQNLPSM